jgi:DNA primase
VVVEDLLKSRGIDFRPSGKDFVVRCLNPEHEDKNPSMRIDKTTGTFNCLSCGFSGNLFSHFGEKANWLQIKRERLTEVISAKLIDAAGLSIPTNAVSFDREWRGISGETFRKFEAFQHNNPEFIGRVVFPIRNVTGKIVAFCGRHQGDKLPKYLIHPTDVSLPLFPIVKPIHGRIILVEGILDMMNLHDKGLTNAVCAFGVNKVTKEKLNILKIQGVTGVDVFYDNDDAGQRGAKNTIELLEKSELLSRLVLISNIKDPGELTASKVISLKKELYGE